MLTLDIQTLLYMVTLIYLLMGVLSFIAAVGSQFGRTLRLAGAANLLGAAAYLVGLLASERLWGSASIWFSNSLLIATTALLWAAISVYVGKRPVWSLIIAGPLLWLLLCTQPWFMDNLAFRIQLFSVLIIAYTTAMGFRLLRHIKKDLWRISTLVLILGLHTLFYLYRLLPEQPANHFIEIPSFSITVIENIFFVITFTYSLLVIAHNRAERQFQHAALHDELTQLPNRRAFFERAVPALTKAQADNVLIAVMMADLDHFKRVNDQFGHAHGNTILQLFADVLQQYMPENAVYARIGGEEFSVLLPCQENTKASRIANQIRESFAAHSSPTNGALSVSIGIALSNNAGYVIDNLLSKSDIALYQAKNAGRNRVQIWHPQSASEPIITNFRGARPNPDNVTSTQNQHNKAHRDNGKLTKPPKAVA